MRVSHIQCPQINHLFSDQFFKVCFAKLGIIEKGRVRVNIGVDTLVNDSSGWMNLTKFNEIQECWGISDILGVPRCYLEILVKLCPPGLLDAMPGQNCCHLLPPSANSFPKPPGPKCLVHLCVGGAVPLEDDSVVHVGLAWVL